MKSNSKLSGSLDKLSKFTLSHPRIINKVSRMVNYNDEPKVYTYVAFFEKENKNNSNSSSGTSFSQKRALIKVIGEAIERYCLNILDKKRLIISSISELKTSYLDPLKVPSFSKNQQAKKLFEQFKFTKDTKFQWVEGYLYNGQKKVLIPAQLIYTGYALLQGEPYIRFPISTGAASHSSVQQALYTGICEIVERDSFMIYYLNKMSAPMVDLSSIQDKSLGHILTILDRYKLNLKVFDLTTDLQIPVYVSVLTDKTGNGPAVSIGLKAGFNVLDAIIGAIEESLMVRTWIRDKFIYENTSFIIPKKLKTIEQRAYFWFKQDSIEHLNFLYDSKKIIKLNILSLKKKDNLESVIHQFKRANINIYYVDITKRVIRDAGFSVLKVFIPELFPLFFDEKFPYFGISRLFKVPVTLGEFQKPKSESELNFIPHPVL